MAILTASQDYLRGDPLKEGEEFDPLSPLASRRIRMMDESLGFAVHPEEREGITRFKEDVDREVGRIKKKRRSYESQARAALAEGDRAASGILSGYSGAPSQQTTKVNVYGPGGVEGTYQVNAQWARENLGGVGTKSGGAYNVNVVQGGRVRGKEIHQAMAGAAQETRQINKQISGVNASVDRARSGAEAEIASQRGIAEREINQTLSQYNRAIKETKAIYTRYITDQQQAFKSGIETNKGGIRNLLESGVLVAKGTVS
jgi:phage shock protein A